MNIAICDDVQNERQTLKNALCAIQMKWDVDFNIDVFHDGQTLLQNVTDGSYEVILLDIEMEGINGIEVSKKIRTLEEECLIIFVSGYDKYLRELFGLRTIAFLDKPVDTNKLEEALKKAKNILDTKADDVFSYISKGKNEFIPFHKIKYFTVQDHYVTIYYAKGEITFKGKISEIWSKIGDREDFIMPNRSFIVNINYASASKTELFIKDSSETISISKKYKEETMLKIMNFLSKRGI